MILWIPFPNGFNGPICPFLLSVREREREREYISLITVLKNSLFSVHGLGHDTTFTECIKQHYFGMVFNQWLAPASIKQNPAICRRLYH